MKRIVEIAMSSYHPDQIVSNLHDIDVKIRVGSNDMTTHPWYSRRIHRLMKVYGINSSLEEVNNRQHWWWDSKSENDGGVLNDQIMRQFYTHCYIRACEEYPNVITNQIQLLLNGQARRSIDFSGAEMDHLYKQHQQLQQHTKTQGSKKSKCFQDFTYVTMDISIQKPLCGLQILQTKYQTRKATVKHKCFTISKQEIMYDSTLNKIPPEFTHNNLRYNLQDIHDDKDGTVHVCSLQTKNVLRLRMYLPFSSKSSQSYENHASIIQKEQAKGHRRYVSIKVNGEDLIFRLPYIHNHTHDDTSIGFVATFGAYKGNYHYDMNGNAYIDLCWHDNDNNADDDSESSGNDSDNGNGNGNGNGNDKKKKKVYFCKHAMNALIERTPLSSGPMRNIYNKPLVIIYGTHIGSYIHVLIHT